MSYQREKEAIKAALATNQLTIDELYRCTGIHPYVINGVLFSPRYRGQFERLPGDDPRLWRLTPSHPLTRELEQEHPVADKEINEIAVILAGLRVALGDAEQRLRTAKVLPPEQASLNERLRYTNLKEARALVNNALAYGRDSGVPDTHARTILIANLEKIGELLRNPDETNHDGPHK